MIGMNSHFFPNSKLPPPLHIVPPVALRPTLGYFK